MEKNLKLAIIGQLMTNDLLPPFDMDVFFEEHLGQVYDGYAEYNEYPIPEVEAYLAEMELNEDDLPRLECLTMDGDNEVYYYIWPQWDGDNEYFSFTSLEGLEQCQHLTTLIIRDILSTDQPLDLMMLTALPGLEELVLNGALLVDLKPLLDILTLTAVNFSDTRIQPSEENQRILDTLKARGVEVTADLHPQLLQAFPD